MPTLFVDGGTVSNPANFAQMPMPGVIPHGWDTDAVQLWDEKKHAEAINRTLARLVEVKWREPRLALQCAYYLFALKDIAYAVRVLNQQVSVTPGHFETVLNLAVALSMGQKWEASAKRYRDAELLRPHSAEVADGLAHVLFRLGKQAQAAAEGTRALELKNQQSRLPLEPGWRLPACKPAEFATRQGKRNVIAFSLWGTEASYLRGALRNALMVSEIYPGWTPRFYVDGSVPVELTATLLGLGAEVMRQPDGEAIRAKLGWRFMVANDPNVGYFLVRDVDSVVGTREAGAVAAWLKSDHWFHVMRDWWTHTDLMLAGMWGGVAGVLPDMTEQLARFTPDRVETVNIDQLFLRECIWPYLRGSLLVHDRLFRPHGASVFPGVPIDGWHVGQDEYAAHSDLQTRWLGPWLNSLACLGGTVKSHDVLPAKLN